MLGVLNKDNISRPPIRLDVESLEDFNQLLELFGSIRPLIMQETVYTGFSATGEFTQRRAVGSLPAILSGIAHKVNSLNFNSSRVLLM